MVLRIYAHLALGGGPAICSMCPEISKEGYEKFIQRKLIDKTRRYAIGYVEVLFDYAFSLRTFLIKLQLLNCSSLQYRDTCDSKPNITGAYRAWIF